MIRNFTQPVNLGKFNIEAGEVMYYLYLPVSTPGLSCFLIPDSRLHFAMPLLHAVKNDMLYKYRTDDVWNESYVYLTIKKMFVGGGVTANRPGWHCDGFLSDDLNYIWFDSAPTVFTTGDFCVSEDHQESLQQFDEQARVEDEYLGQTHTLYRLDDKCIHRVNVDIPQQIMRTFVKITVSPNRFNLKDNSKNPLLPDNGPFYDRSLVRNDPHQAQRDSYNPQEM